MRVIGGFGSAGDGSRSLRRTKTGIKTGMSTATVVDMVQGKSVPPASLDDPSKEELQKWIAAGRCWWCKSEKVFHILAQHWTRGHGLDLQHIRDILEVRKRTSFISEELKEKLRERQIRLWGPKGVPDGFLGTGARATHRQLSKFGIKSQRERSKKVSPEGRQRFFEAAKERTSKIKSERPLLTCVVCGCEFIPNRCLSHSRITCSKECDIERRRMYGKARYAEGKLLGIGKKPPLSSAS